MLTTIHTVFYLGNALTHTYDDKFYKVKKIKIVGLPVTGCTCSNIAVGVTNSSISATIPEQEWANGDYDGEFFPMFVPTGTTGTEMKEYSFDFSESTQSQSWTTLALFSLDTNAAKAIYLVDLTVEDVEDYFDATEISTTHLIV